MFSLSLPLSHTHKLIHTHTLTHLNTVYHSPHLTRRPAIRKDIMLQMLKRIFSFDGKKRIFSFDGKLSHSFIFHVTVENAQIYAET